MGRLEWRPRDACTSTRPDGLDRGPLAGLQRVGVLVTIGTSGPGRPPAPLAVPGSRRSLGTTTSRSHSTPKSGACRLPRVLPVVLVTAAAVLLAAPGWAQEQAGPAYRAFPIIGSRLAIWVI